MDIAPGGIYYRNIIDGPPMPGQENSEVPEEPLIIGVNTSLVRPNTILSYVEWDDSTLWTSNSLPVETQTQTFRRMQIHFSL